MGVFSAIATAALGRLGLGVPPKKGSDVSWTWHIGFRSDSIFPSIFVSRTGTPVGPLPAGTLLLSNMRGGQFEDTVVLLAKHSQRGAVGFVVNKELPRDLGELTARVPLPPAAAPLRQPQPPGDETPAAPAFFFGWGGPIVHPKMDPDNGAWTLAHPYRVPGATLVAKGVLLGGTVEAVRDSARRASQQQQPAHQAMSALLLLGYAGWGPLQLDGELRAGDWTSCPQERYNSSILFGGLVGKDLAAALRQVCTAPPPAAAAAP
eukprot:TRINITY_DN22512_c0_g2_i1.p1 TRINITY_DN22512_c0_g2~~TRINITY_DN22512_c0_g2_i1.p1  ORF type:complete len:285 (+),score=68.33 TRINITY_DN22512_c0_g2_i1:68-856(+)